MTKKTILLDLDGVLNEYKGEYHQNSIPKVKEETKLFLESLSKDFQIIIFTSRNLLLTSKWLIENKLDSFIFDVSNIKRPAFLQIDDRAIQFKGDFNNLIEQIKNFKPHWKH